MDVVVVHPCNFIFCLLYLSVRLSVPLSPSPPPSLFFFSLDHYFSKFSYYYVLVYSIFFCFTLCLHLESFNKVNILSLYFLNSVCLSLFSLSTSLSFALCLSYSFNQNYSLKSSFSQTRLWKPSSRRSLRLQLGKPSPRNATAPRTSTAQCFVTPLGASHLSPSERTITCRTQCGTLILYMNYLLKCIVSSRFLSKLAATSDSSLVT